MDVLQVLLDDAVQVFVGSFLSNGCEFNHQREAERSRLSFLF